MKQLFQHRLLAAAGLLIVLRAGADAQTANTPAQPQASHAAAIEQVVVTATRRPEKLEKVPLSISAFSDVKMDVLGVKSFAQLAKFTPGVTYDPDAHDVYIRGIDLTAGSGTTGIYIDDTPIQI